MRWKLALSISTAILLLSVGIAMVRGQEITATILGTVRDISGGTISGATITVTNEGTGVSRTVVSDANGDYLVNLLLVGVYTVKVEKSGFVTYVQKGIQLVVNQNARIDTSLKPGGVDQSVTVEANAAQLETSVATIGKVMEEKSVTQLPLNGRNYLQLGVLQPGVAPITTNLSKSGSAAAADQGFAVNGLRTQANVFLVDGALNSDMFYTSSNLKPPPDSIQEFKILTNSYTPEYWGGGSVVILSFVLVRISFTARYGNSCATIFSMRAISSPRPLRPSNRTSSEAAPADRSSSLRFTTGQTRRSSTPTTTASATARASRPLPLSQLLPWLRATSMAFRIHRTCREQLRRTPTTWCP